MTQLYSRVFLQILDSSLADDWQVRHVFEDMLKFSDGGVVDMTRDALVRRTNIPRDVIDRAIAVLEAPDASSRDPREDGRRITRLDAHRDWGWLIVNWDKYERIKSAEDQKQKTAERVRRYRERKAKASPKSPSTPPSTGTEAEADTETEDALQKRNASLHSVTFTEPSESELDLHASKIGLPKSEVEKFVAFYRSNGWRVGKNRMKCWRSAMSGWRVRWEERRHQDAVKRPGQPKPMSGEEAFVSAIKAINP